ncbi:hypothetical protein HOU95_gp120 [Streptomyces phage Hiyaa]|uniref:Uncharacterized protein n=1 Tax=Streptomyces phage Hiyaa TaxID=2499072 RepID=A0A3S9U8P8_9CAUD|nr:hypothetical protein HOU95_gp120 [Streptomyces phage Hiyaa]AZS06687.1 hypothetical protein SEA_HIYAA_48 [Streptomyces phage Hiyaa]
MQLVRPRWVRLKRALAYFVDHVMPPMIGAFVGLSIGTALWLLALLWWLNA